LTTFPAQPIRRDNYTELVKKVTTTIVLQRTEAGVPEALGLETTNLEFPVAVCPAPTASTSFLSANPQSIVPPVEDFDWALCSWPFTHLDFLLSSATAVALALAVLHPTSVPSLHSCSHEAVHVAS
jgi:hypothetical protein